MEAVGTGFQRKTIFLFLAAAALLLVVSAGVIALTGSDHIQQRIVESLTQQLPASIAGNIDTSAVGRVLLQLQVALVAAAAVLLFALLVVMALVVRKVARPIDEMGSAAASIARGRLDALPDAKATDNGEIGKIAELIGDMALNLQEILLLAWNHTGQHQRSLKRLQEVLTRNGDHAPTDECLAAIEELRRQTEEMRQTIQAFDFYDVRLSETAALPAAGGKSPTAP